MNNDPVIRHLDLIARALEAMGYTVEVDYTSAIVIVWLDEWPVVIEVRRRKFKECPVTSQPVEENGGNSRFPHNK